jgi:hypothetical protein
LKLWDPVWEGGLLVDWYLLTGMRIRVVLGMELAWGDGGIGVSAQDRHPDANIF